jgi:AcrR family transcriptional regulator
MVERLRKKPKGSFHHGDLRAALVLAAFRAIERRGHESLTLRAVAQDVGVTQPAMYRHFESRDALLAAEGAHGYERFAAACVDAARAAFADADPWAPGRAALVAYVRFAADHPRWFRLWSSRAWNEDLATRVPGDDLARRRASVEPLRALIVRAARDDAPIDDLFRSVWGLAHGLAVLVVERVFRLVETDAERVAAAEAAIDVALAGMRARYGR